MGWWRVCVCGCGRLSAEAWCISASPLMRTKKRIESHLPWQPCPAVRHAKARSWARRDGQQRDAKTGSVVKVFSWHPEQWACWSGEPIPLCTRLFYSAGMCGSCRVRKYAMRCMPSCWLSLRLVDALILTLSSALWVEWKVSSLSLHMISCQELPQLFASFISGLRCSSSTWIMCQGSQISSLSLIHLSTWSWKLTVSGLLREQWCTSSFSASHRCETCERGLGHMVFSMILVLMPTKS